MEGLSTCCSQPFSTQKTNKLPSLIFRAFLNLSGLAQTTLSSLSTFELGRTTPFLGKLKCVLTKEALHPTLPGLFLPLKSLLKFSSSFQVQQSCLWSFPVPPTQNPLYSWAAFRVCVSASCDHSPSHLSYGTNWVCVVFLLLDDSPVGGLGDSCIGTVPPCFKQGSNKCLLWTMYWNT